MPPCFPRSDQLQRLFAAGQRASGDLQLHVELEQVEVGAGDIGDDCGDHRLAIVVAGEQVSPRRFRRAAQPAPDISFERDEVDSDAAECPVLREALEEGEVRQPRKSAPSSRRRCRQRWGTGRPG